MWLVLPMSRFCFVTLLLPYITSRLVGTDRDRVIHCPVHWADRLVPLVLVVVVGVTLHTKALLYCRLISMMMTQL